jgi:hypothetical protein
LEHLVASILTVKSEAAKYPATPLRGVTTHKMSTKIFVAVETSHLVDFLYDEHFLLLRKLLEHD